MFNVDLQEGKKINLTEELVNIYWGLFIYLLERQKAVTQLLILPLPTASEASSGCGWSQEQNLSFLRGVWNPTPRVTAGGPQSLLEGRRRQEQKLRIQSRHMLIHYGYY